MYQSGLGTQYRYRYVHMYCAHRTGMYEYVDRSATSSVLVHMYITYRYIDVPCTYKVALQGARYDVQVHTCRYLRFSRLRLGSATVS